MWPNKVRYLAACSFLALSARESASQKTILCGGVSRYEFDAKVLQTEYSGTRFSSTFSALSIQSKIDIDPKQVQELAVATQVWNLFLRALAESYNKCLITNDQFYEALRSDYPRLNIDISEVEKEITALNENQGEDTKKLKASIDKFHADFMKFVGNSGQEDLIKKIDALRDQLSTADLTLAEKLDRISGQLNEANDKLFSIQSADGVKANLNKFSQKAVPEAANPDLRETREKLTAVATTAGSEYEKGYNQLMLYRYREAIPHFENALASVRLPEFYLALGICYWQLSDFPQAEGNLLKGTKASKFNEDLRSEGRLTAQLSILYSELGRRQEAVDLSEKSLSIFRSLGIRDGNVAMTENNLGVILRLQGDFRRALPHAQQAVNVASTEFGIDHPFTAIAKDELAELLARTGDFQQALELANEALQIDVSYYGADSIPVAIRYNNLSGILQEQATHDKKYDAALMDRALEYSQRAAKTAERVYGPNHPYVATCLQSLAFLYYGKGELDRAAIYANRALEINENAYGPKHPKIASCLNIISLIYRKKELYEAAISAAKRALEIDESGANQYNVAVICNNLGWALIEAGRKVEGISYIQRSYNLILGQFGLNNFYTERARQSPDDAQNFGK